MSEFKKVLCVKDNGIAEPGLTYYYTVGSSWHFNSKWEFVKTDTKVYHVYVAENKDAWIFNLGEKDFNETFKEI